MLTELGGYAIASQKNSAITSLHRYPVIIGNVRIPLFFKFYQNPNKLSFSFKKEYQQTRTIGGYVFEHWGRQPVTMRGEVLLKKDSSLSNLIGINTSKTNYGIEDPMYSPELMTLQTLFNIDQRRIKNLFGATADNIVSKSITYTIAATAALKNPVIAVTAGVQGAASLYSVISSNKEAKIKFKEPEPASLEGYLSTLTDTIILYKGVIYSGFFTSLSFDEDAMTPFSNKVVFDFLVTGTTNDWVDTNLTQTAGGRAIAGVWGAATSTTTIASMVNDIFTNTGTDTNGHI